MGRMRLVLYLVFLVPAMASAKADVLVYKQTCGFSAFENWNVECAIKENTFESLDKAQFWWADAFREMKSITICASFANRGGLNVPATVVYNYKDSHQAKPTDFFDTVQYRGDLASSRMIWSGSGGRAWSRGWAMQGVLSADTQSGAFSYNEILSNGSRKLGEIRALCRRLDE